MTENLSYMYMYVYMLHVCTYVTNRYHLFKGRHAGKRHVANSKRPSGGQAAGGRVMAEHEATGARAGGGQAISDIIFSLSSNI